MISHNLNNIRTAISTTEQQYNRKPGSVKLLAVSKTQTLEKIRLATAAGQQEFGESYLQEALPKIIELATENLTWHYIGRIQTKKIKLLAQNFAWVQTVTDFTSAELLSTTRPTLLPPLNICIQVNISSDPNKSGIARENIFALAEQISTLPNLKFRGLMTIPAYLEDFAEQYAMYQKLHEEFIKLKTAGFAVDTLSMGMSHDFPAAIAAGSTMVRIGTAVFGERL